MCKWKIIRKATSFTPLRLTCCNITQVIRKCEMLTNFSRILTCYLTQFYLLKRKIYYASATDVFPGNLGIFYRSRSSHRKWVLCKNDVLKNFTIFIEKRLCWSHFFNKVAESCCLQHCRFIKKRLQYRCFSVNIVIFLRTRIMKNICK